MMWRGARVAVMYRIGRTQWVLPAPPLTRQTNDGRYPRAPGLAAARCCVQLCGRAPRLGASCGQSSQLTGALKYGIWSLVDDKIKSPSHVFSSLPSSGGAMPSQAARKARFICGKAARALVCAAKNRARARPSLTPFSEEEA